MWNILKEQANLVYSPMYKVFMIYVDRATWLRRTNENNSESIVIPWQTYEEPSTLESKNMTNLVVNCEVFLHRNYTKQTQNKKVAELHMWFLTKNSLWITLYNNKYILSFLYSDSMKMSTYVLIFKSTIMIKPMQWYLLFAIPVGP